MKKLTKSGYPTDLHPPYIRSNFESIVYREVRFVKERGKPSSQNETKRSEIRFELSKFEEETSFRFFAKMKRLGRKIEKSCGYLDK